MSSDKPPKEKKKPKEWKSTTVEITKAEADVEDVGLKLKRKDWVRWIGTDDDYELWFRTADYAFDRPEDTTEPGYKIIKVEKGKHTHKYVLDYDLPAGQQREHPYEIRRASARFIPGGPEGPSVWGEG